MSQLSNSWGGSPLVFGDRYGLGINRRTWEAGKLIGRAAKRWLSKRKAPNAPRKQAPKKHKNVTQASVVEFDGMGGTMSQFRFKGYHMKLPKNVLAELCFNPNISNSSGQILTTAGLMSYSEIGPLFNGATITGFAGITATTNGKVILKSVTAEVTFTNVTNTTARLKIYDIMPRRDFSNATITGPGQAWQTGQTDEGSGSGASYLIPGSDPTSSKTFVEMFIIKNREDILLPPGGTHLHKISLAPNYAIDYALAHYGTWWKDLSYTCLAVAHGQASDAVTGGGAGTVSLGVAKVNWVLTKQYKTSWIADNTTSATVTNSLPTSFTGGENTVGLGNSTVQVEATA